jgi:fimbrial chaperone protein
MHGIKASWRTLRGCALLLLGLLSAPWSQAGSFQVSPVRTTLSAAQGVGSMTVRNDGTEPIVIQLQVMSWSQQQGKDVYNPTREIVATPPIFIVPPHGTQIVRVGLRRSPDAQRELTYRLYLQEVPPPRKADLTGLQMALRIGVPVFVKPSVATAPVLRWQAVRTPQGLLRISLNNSGNAHIQVANLTLRSADGTGLGILQTAAYVLPGQSSAWLVKVAAPPGATLRIRAQTDAGDIPADVVVPQT